MPPGKHTSPGGGVVDGWGRHGQSTWRRCGCSGERSRRHAARTGLAPSLPVPSVSPSFLPLCVFSLGDRWFSTTCTSPVAGSSNRGTSTAANLPDTWRGRGGGDGRTRRLNGAQQQATPSAVVDGGRHRRLVHLSASICKTPNLQNQTRGCMPGHHPRTGGAADACEQDTCRLLTTRSSRHSSAARAAAALRVATMPAAVVAPAAAATAVPPAVAGGAAAPRLSRALPVLLLTVAW